MSVRRPLAIALASSVALAGLVTVAATSASGAPPTNVQPRVVPVDDTTVWAAIKTVPLPVVSGPALVDIAVNGWDDTVYVANSVTQRLSVINGTTGELDDSYVVGAVKAVAVDQNDDTIYTVTSPPTGSDNKVQSRSATAPGSAVTDDTVISAVSLAVDSLDDTVYVSQSSTPGTITYFSGRTPLIDDSENVGGRGAFGIAVDASDDSVWMSLSSDDSVRAWSGRTNVLGSFIGGVGDVPYAVAVNELDDTVYVGNASGCGVPCRTIQVIDGRTASVGTPIPIPNGSVDNSSLRGIAIDSVRHALFVAIPGASSSLGYINEQQTDDSVFLAPVPNGGGSFFANVVAVDDSGVNAGLVWALDGQAASYVMAFAQVDPALVTTTGAAGDAVTVSVASTPTVGFPMDDSAVIGMRFAGTSSVTRVTAGTGDQWSVALPSGLPTGPVSVEVQFNGGQYARTAADYTVLASSPTITSVSPSSGPTAGGTSVTITGTNLTGATSVTFGGTAGTITANTSTSITVTTPAGAAGAVNVAVTTAGGAGASASAFTYVAPTPPPPPPLYPPGPPRDIAAAAGDASATVSWAAPSDPGTFAVTEYEVTSSPASRTCVVVAPATSCTVTGLTNGTSYTFTVMALSAAGAGPPSGASNAVTPFAPRAPGAPTAVSATAGNAQAVVSWIAPADTGTGPIVDYEAVSSPGGVTCLVNPPSTSCTVTGLINGTSYTFAVRARNAVGWGSASSSSNAVTPRPPSILITGSRDSADTRYVRVQGTTTDLVGKQVTPYVRFPGQTGYTAGIGIQTVATDGTFTWQRKTGKRTNVYFMHGEVRSNTVTIRAR